MQILTVGLLMLVFLALGDLISRRSNFYGQIARPKPGARFASLDGFRGFLALGVFLHHAAATHLFLRTGQWDVPANPFRQLGPVPVIFFFMITGFLFWLKALQAKPRLAILELYRGRALRIVPLYTLSAVAMLVILLALTGLPSPSSHGAFAGGVSRLLFGMGILKPTPINGLDPGDLNAGVLWTLHSEWKFYLALPLLALLARPRGLILMVAAFLALHFATHSTMASPAMFLCGMGAAQLYHAFGPQPWATGWLATALCLSIIVASLSLVQNAFEIPVYLLLFYVIYCLVNGGTLGGVLATRGARVLGAMSYSIYILHGIILFLARPLLAPFDHTENFSPAYWLMVGAIGLVVICTSALTYRFVEHPFMALEKRLKKPRSALPSNVAAAIPQLT